MPRHGSARAASASPRGTPARGGPGLEVTDEVEAVYRRLVGRRQDPNGNPEIRTRLRGAGLHPLRPAHAHRSLAGLRDARRSCCSRPPRSRGSARSRSPTTTRSPGRCEAREIAERIGGIKVIVAEEVKTAHQGEVIGLFLTERIERGMSMAETIGEIRRQGGLVYVPHPFDRLHSVPDYEHLLEIVEEIDILEVFNPRVAFSAFNEEAVRFARKYSIVPGAGSDSHVAQGLGSVKIRLRDFEGPQEFLESMRDADIVRKHKNLVYVQALKFLQTSGGRGGRSLAERDGRRKPRTARSRARVDALARGRGRAEEKARRRVIHHRRRDPREVPGARDPGAERPGQGPGRLRGLPARQRDAGAGIRPSPGRHLHAEARRRLPRRSRRGSPSTAGPATP